MTTNPYYQASGNPGTRTVGLSQLVRAEFLALQAGFDLIPRIATNRLHNPGFRVIQRGFTVGTTLAAGDYGNDRWKAGAAGCTYVRAASGNVFQLQITAGSLVQIIEGTDIEGGSYVLSWVGNATAQINGGGFSSSPLAVTGISANTNLTVEIATGFVSQPQFAPGTASAQFELPPIVLDIINCQRFFLSGGATLATYAGGAGAVTGPFYNFPVQMRAGGALNVTITGASYVNGSAGALTANRNGLLPTWTAAGVGATTFAPNFTVSSDL